MMQMPYHTSCILYQITKNRLLQCVRCRMSRNGMWLESQGLMHPLRRRPTDACHFAPLMSFLRHNPPTLNEFLQGVITTAGREKHDPVGPDFCGC